MLLVPTTTVEEVDVAVEVVAAVTMIGIADMLQRRSSFMANSIIISSANIAQVIPRNRSATVGALMKVMLNLQTNRQGRASPRLMRRRH